jgi:hypothetical protein
VGLDSDHGFFLFNMILNQLSLRYWKPGVE